jgi:predicted transposase YbfD/YdcC
MPRRKTIPQEFIDLSQQVDAKSLKESIRGGFADFPDPRDSKDITYPVWYLVFSALCAYLSGCDDLAAIVHFVQIRRKWFSELLEEDPGAPSYDTFWWFFVRTDPSMLKSLLQRWLGNLPTALRGQLLAIDGKRLNGASIAKPLVCLVELFATENGLTLAVERVPNKEGESKALPALLESVDVTGAIISGDALYANNTIATQITDKGADYIFGLKGNQGLLHAEVANFFDQARAVNYEGVTHDHYTTLEKGHGRTEERRIRVVTDIEWLPQREAWSKLSTIIEVETKRQKGDKAEFFLRYYISSRSGSAKEFAHWIRGHWGIENNLHWVADVIFAEDESRSNVGNSAENMGLMRRLSMNLVKYVDSTRGFADARRCAMYEPNYLKGLLAKMLVK